MRKRQSCGTAIRLPGLVEGANGAGEEEGKLMTWLKGLPGAQAPFGPFGQTQSNLVKLGQTQTKRKEGFDRQTPSGLRNFATGQKMA
jgi:hypothetical protein